MKPHISVGGVDTLAYISFWKVNGHTVEWTQRAHASHDLLFVFSDYRSGCDLLVRETQMFVAI